MVGETLRVPDPATVPIAWLMVTDVALVVDQERVAAPPTAIEAGDAVRVAVGHGAAVTVTAAVAVTEPTLLAAVTV